MLLVIQHKPSFIHTRFNLYYLLNLSVRSVNILSPIASIAVEPPDVPPVITILGRVTLAIASATPTFVLYSH